MTLAGERPLSDLEKQGLIQAFEFTHELAWNVMKDYFAFQGNSSITGSRDAVRESFASGLKGRYREGDGIYKDPKALGQNYKLEVPTDDGKLEEGMRRIVRQSAQDEIGKKPEVTVVISRLSA